MSELSQKRCDVCSKLFVPKHSRHLRCSIACRREAARRRVNFRYANDPELRAVKIAVAAQWNRQNPEAWAQSRRNWRAVSANKERENRLSRWRGDSLKYKYGITVEQKDALVEQQGGCCAICLNFFESTKDTQVDHCHQTGAVRGILCSRCNTAVGLFKDDALRLQKAIRYLNGGNADLVSTILRPANEALRDGREPDAGSNADPRVFTKRPEA